MTPLHAFRLQYSVTSFVIGLLSTTQLYAQSMSITSINVASPRSGFMVPRVAPLRATTDAEARADEVWNLRAALNVAALQCQFSPFLRTVRNYNEMLKHHSHELNTAQTIMKSHFRRYDGTKAIISFDQYTTRTYNSFSTLDAQYSFCDAAAQVGREVLTLKRGELSAAAAHHVTILRASLYPQASLPLYAISLPAPVQLAQIEPPKGHRRRQR